MAQKANAFMNPLKDLFGSLTELTYASFVHSSMTRETEKRLTQKVKEWKAGPHAASPNFGASSRLAVPLLTDRSTYVYPHPGIGAADEAHIRVLRELDQRSHGHLLAMGFEAMERFLKRFAASLLFITRTQAMQQRVRMPLHKNRFHAQRDKSGRSKATPGTPQYFADYVNWHARRNCGELLKDLRRALPKFDETGRRNWLGTDLFEFIRVLGFCRHQIVHAGGECDRSELKQFPAEWQRLLAHKVLRTSVITSRPTLLPDAGFLSFANTRLAGFGAVLCQIASTELGMRFELPVEVRQEK